MRAALLAVPLLWLAAGGCGGGGLRPGDPPRDLVLVTVSSLRADRLSSWLYPRPTGVAMRKPGEVPPAPGGLAFDDLAARGVAFVRAFAPSAMSRPSLASLHTGTRPLQHCVLDEEGILDEAGATTLAERFAAAGYRTAAFTAGGAAVPGSGLERGFEVFTSTPAGDDPDFRDDPGGQVLAPGAGGRRSAVPLAPPRWSLAAPRAGPLHSIDFVDLFADPGASEPGVDALYDAEVARVNKLVGGFLEALQGADAARFEGTAIVLAGDRGAELARRSERVEEPASLHDSSLHVPLVLFHPRNITGRRAMDEVVELVDVARTLFEWFELPEPGGPVGGRSLLALIIPKARGASTPGPPSGATRPAR